MFVAGGNGTNTMAYSYNGINWSNASATNVGAGRMDRLVYYNNSIWIGTGIFSDCNIKYSYDGINWSNARYSGLMTIGAGSGSANCSNQSLVVSENMVCLSFSGPGVGDQNTACTTVRSYDGINYIDSTVGGPPFIQIFDQIYDGNYFIGYGNQTQNRILPGGVFGAYVQKLVTKNSYDNDGRKDSSQNGYVASGINYPGQRGKGVVRSNVIPQLSMSNLKIYGSNFNNVALSTNTISGCANLVLWGMTGGTDGNTDTDFAERKNYLDFNNTLKIWGTLSTQVTIHSPNNPNVRNNTFNLPRATLDVLCTINVRNATSFKRLKQVPAPFYPSSIGIRDEGIDFYVTGSTFMTNVGVGQGANCNAFFSTPTSFFDIYNGGDGSYVTFRETVSNDTRVKALLAATGNSFNVTCYPMVTGLNSQLVYYWRNNNQNYRGLDTNGTGFFTGQHPTNCLDIDQSIVNDYVGQLVSITNDGYTIYDTYGNQLRGKEAIQITSAAPITRLTTKDADPAVFGVVANCFNDGLRPDGSIDTYSDSEFVTNLFGRIMVNSIGEGALWVTNWNGNVSNGDYLCSCPIPGLARVQDSGRLMNYTIAKATMSCDFNPPFLSTMSTFLFEGSTLSTMVSCLAYKCEAVEFNGSSFLKAFIGCTYHCN
jgi:hypothetical protein